LLSADDHKETLAQLAEFDWGVSKIGLDCAKKYIQTLGKDGVAEVRNRLEELDAGSDDAALYKSTNHKYDGAAGDAEYRQGGVDRAAALKEDFPGSQRQPYKTLLELLVFATADEAHFKMQVKFLGLACGSEVLLATIKGSSLKGILRLMEKAIIKAIVNDWDEVNFSDIRDVLRSMLVCGTSDTSFEDDTVVAVKAQETVYGGEALSPRRSKCRLRGKSITEWRDELINVEVTTGKYMLLGEIQIVRFKMLMQRETMGGHDGYDESRGLRGLLDATEKIFLSDEGDPQAKLSKKDLEKVRKLVARRDAAIKKSAKSKAKAEALNLKIQTITGEEQAPVEI
jgi:hypothetical protein